MDVYGRAPGKRLPQPPLRNQITPDVPGGFAKARKRQPVRCSNLTCFSAALRPIS